MPYQRRSRNDRHGLAPGSRFLEGEVLSALDIQDQTPPRPRAPAVAVVHAPISVDLDHLWR
jgi:hypothetical protein